MAKDKFTCDCDMIHEDVVNEVRVKMPDTEQFEKVSQFFKVFGDDTRSKIIWALDENEMCVCDLSNLLDMTKSAVSHQLSILRQANLVKYRRDGKNIFYSLSDMHVKEIFEMGIEHINE